MFFLSFKNRARTVSAAVAMVAALGGNSCCAYARSMDQRYGGNRTGSGGVSLRGTGRPETRRVQNLQRINTPISMPTRRGAWASPKRPSNARASRPRDSWTTGSDTMTGGMSRLSFSTIGSAALSNTGMSNRNAFSYDASDPMAMTHKDWKLVGRRLKDGETLASTGKNDMARTHRPLPTLRTGRSESSFAETARTNASGRSAFFRGNGR